MSFSDDTLIAYADGELDEATRRAIELAMLHDAGVARRVAQHRAMRAELFASAADHGMPEHAGAELADVSASPGAGRATARRPAKVVQLAAVRASRAAQQNAVRKARRRRWGWLEWSMLGVVLVLGVAAGKFGLARWQPGWAGESAGAGLLAGRDGALAAQGKLATALTQQPGGASQFDAEVRVGLTFLSTEGNYCRTFTLPGTVQDLNGLACRLGQEWRIPLLVQQPKPQPQMGNYHQAGTQVPGALMEAIDQRIAGGMLDAKAEMAALRRNWQR
ncbi:hypothetical protein HSX11_23270 [Oxalobacteraceae bacterium]|nr:hypothetical protein [Oxalobacteraceae bacterium]